MDISFRTFFRVGQMINQEDVVDVLAKKSIKRCWNLWGIDATFDKIHELCINKAMKECFLKNYYELLRGQ